MEAVREMGSNRIHVIPAYLPVGGQEERGPMWDRTLLVLGEILWHLHESGLLPDLRLVHREVCVREPHIAPAVLAWLAGRGTPGVEARWASAAH